MLYEIVLSGAVIRFLSLDFLVYHIEFCERIKTRLAFAKGVKFANEMTDDIIHAPQYHVELYQ